MNRITEHPMELTKAKKLFTFSMIFLCLLPILLDTVIITPLYVMLQSNIAFSGGALSTAVYYFKDVLSILAFASSYAIIIFSLLFLERRIARYIVLIYTSVFFVQIPLKLLINIFLYGSLGSAWEILNDVIYLVFYFLLNMIQLLVIYFIASADMNRYLRHREISRAIEKKKGKQTETKASVVLPISKFFDRYNPLQRSALKMSIFMIALKLLSRALNDISYGAPTSFGEVLVMIAYYLSDILYGIAAYLIALLIFTFIYDKLKKSEVEETEVSSTPEEMSIISGD